MAFYSRPVGDGGLRRSSPLTWVSSFREPMPVVLFDTPRRRWSLWRFASLIPSGCRLPPIHKVMGDHASRDSTSAGASSATWSFPVVFRDLCLPQPDLGSPSGGVAGRGHAAVLQGVDLQVVIKTGRGNVAKKWLRFHALVKLLSDYQ